MKSSLLCFLCFGFFSSWAFSGEQELPSLKSAFKGDFLMGVALSSAQIKSEDEQLRRWLDRQFNSFTAENSMKWDMLQSIEGVFDFREADALVEFGRKSDAFVVGHTLVWQRVTPGWVFLDKDGKQAGRDLVLKRLKMHIYQVAGRYREGVHAWDVVNEAFDEDGSWRDTAWYRVLGEEYVFKAFEYAAEAAPNAELYYNDYHLFKPEKRQAIVALVNKLKARGLRIDGIGIQGHYSLDYPDIRKIDKAVSELSGLGLKVMFTEVDVSVLPHPVDEQKALYKEGDVETVREMNPFVDGMPKWAKEKLASRYVDLFKLFLTHKDAISRVTFWSVNDGNSWWNHWPLEGRTDYPVLFDRNNQPKIAFYEVLKLGRSAD